MYKRVQKAAVIAALVAGPALLANQANAQGMPAPTFGWTGFHIGGGGGFGVVNHNAGFSLYEYLELPYEDDVTPGADIYAFGGDVDFGGMGDLFAIRGGFDVQFNRFVFGVGGDYIFSDMRTQLNLAGEICYEDGGGPDDCDTATISDDPTANLIVRMDDSWSVWGRLGFVATPRTMFYALGGYSQTLVTVEGNLDSEATGYDQIITDPFWMPGLIFGAGVQTFVTPHISVGLEYRGTHFRFEEGFADEEFGIMFFDNVLTHTVMGTVAFHIGEMGTRFPDGAFTPDPVSWTGYHIGVFGGLSFSNHKVGAAGWDYSEGGLFQIGGGDGADIFSIAGQIDLGGQGFFGSIQNGVDVQIGNHLVVGLFGDFTLSSLTAEANGHWSVCYDDPAVCNADGEPFPEPDGTFEFDLRTVSSWTVGARVGVLTGPRTLVYALGGVTRVNLAAEGTIYPDGDPPIMESYAFTRNAVTFGLGVEAMLSHNLSATLEYRGTLWSMEEEIFFGPDAGAAIFGLNYIQSVRAGISWRPGASN